MYIIVRIYKYNVPFINGNKWLRLMKLYMMFRIKLYDIYYITMMYYYINYIPKFPALYIYIYII